MDEETTFQHVSEPLSPLLKKIRRNMDARQAEAAAREALRVHLETGDMRFLLHFDDLATRQQLVG